MESWDLQREEEKKSSQQQYKALARTSSLNSDHSKPRVKGPLSFLDDKQKGEWSDFNGFWPIFEILVGFSNATQFTFGENRTECQFAIEALYSSAQDATELLMRDWYNYWDTWKAFDTYLIVTYNLYTIQFSCFESVTEIQELSRRYGLFTTEQDVLVFNFFYNTGSIIKSITNIAMYFIASEYTRVNSPFSLGMELGQIVFMIFYPTEEYLDEALAEGAEWGQDYTWDQVIAIETSVIGTPSEFQLEEGGQEGGAEVQPASSSVL